MQTNRTVVASVMLAFMLAVTIAPSTSAGHNNQYSCNPRNPAVCVWAHVVTPIDGSYVEATGSAKANTFAEAGLVGTAYTSFGDYPLGDDCDLPLIGGTCEMDDTYYSPPNAICGESTTSILTALAVAWVDHDTDC